MLRIQTYTGKLVNPLALKLEDISIEDIAHSLALKCRFGGHTTRFLSVAEHSVNVSKLVSWEYALPALLHDASEAYLPDIASPLKPYAHFLEEDGGYAPFSEIERRIQRAILARFSIPELSPAVQEVHTMDLQCLWLERDQFLRPAVTAWGDTPSFNLYINGLSPIQAEDLFLERFTRLTGGRF